MKIIGFDTISDLHIAPVQCIEWAKHMLLNKYECSLPPKISLKMKGDIFVNTMPSCIPEINRHGVKVVSRYPQRMPALVSEILLYDSISGETLAFMDGTWITAMRTGAVAALSAQTFQKSGANQYAFMGLGNTARATLVCLAELFRNKDLYIKVLAYKNQERDFIKRFEMYSNLHFSVCDNTKTLINGSDVVISCITSASGQIATDEEFKPGVTVIPVHTRGFQNCDLFFDKVFADDTDHVKDFKYFKSFKQFDEVSKVLLKKSVGRASEQERILVYNIGISLHDIYFASKIYDLVTNESMQVVLSTNNNKFWL